MDIRNRLKADFGNDVLVTGGSGVRDDPFIIEPCSAADAIRRDQRLEHPMLKELSSADSRATEVHTVCNEIQSIYPHAEWPWPLQEWSRFYCSTF